MSSLGLTYSVPLALANGLSIAVGIYAVYLLTCVADSMFNKYRTLLLASTVTNISSRLWTSVLMQPAMIPGLELTAVTGPICRLGPWSANFANVTLIFFLSAAPMPSILTFIYRFKLMTTDDQYSVKNRSTVAVATAFVFCIPAIFAVGYALSLVSTNDAKHYFETRYPGIEPFLRSGICIYAYDDRRYTFQIVLCIQVVAVTACEALCFALAYRIFKTLQQHAKVLSTRTYRQQKQFNVMLLSDLLCQFFTLLIPLVLQPLLFLTGATWKLAVFDYLETCHPLVNGLLIVVLIAPFREHTLGLLRRPLEVARGRSNRVIHQVSRVEPTSHFEIKI